MSDNIEFGYNGTSKENPPISLKRSDVNLNDIHEQLKLNPRIRRETVKQALRELRNRPSDYINLFDLDNIRPRYPIFDPISGSLIIESFPEDSHFRSFYKPGRFFNINGPEADRRTNPTHYFSESEEIEKSTVDLPFPRIDLKGPRLLLGVDPFNSRKLKDRLPSLKEKVEIIFDDSIDAIHYLSTFDRRSVKNQNELKLFLGVLDYLKTHAMTIFHIITYDERGIDKQYADMNP